MIKMIGKYQFHKTNNVYMSWKLTHRQIKQLLKDTHTSIEDYDVVMVGSSKFGIEYKLIIKGEM